MIDAKKKIATALAAVAEQGCSNTVAAYDVLRFAKAGYLNIDAPKFNKMFTNWYPRNPDYLILTLAASGSLSMNLDVVKSSK